MSFMICRSMCPTAQVMVIPEGDLQALNQGAMRSLER